MRNPRRIKPMLDMIERIWSANPDLRLLQLLLNCVDEPGAYRIEDSDLVLSLDYFYNDKKELDEKNT